MKVGLFFGSFNPIHTGHLIVASYLYETLNLNSVWFVVSPQNPFKKHEKIINKQHRYQTIYETIKDDKRFEVSNIEFNLPKPNYTVDTLRVLFDKFPKYDFSLLIGKDNAVNFDKWKNYNYILEYHKTYIYPRKDKTLNNILKHKNLIFVEEAPLVEVSSTYIRNKIKHRKNVSYFLHPKTEEYINSMNLYKWVFFI